MPWETKTVMKQREEFIEAAEANSVNFSALCREHGISRKTGYKWLKRAQMGQQLLDKSRCPHRQPSKTAEETESLIVAVREANPAWGGRMIKSVLEAAGCQGIPSEKTCTNILKRNGLIDSEESKKHMPCQRFERKKCNQLWQIDFKGDFLLHDGTRCYVSSHVVTHVSLDTSPRPTRVLCPTVMYGILRKIRNLCLPAVLRLLTFPTKKAIILSDYVSTQSLSKAILRTTPTGVKAIRTAGSTADWRLAALLIELKAQIL